MCKVACTSTNDSSFLVKACALTVLLPYPTKKLQAMTGDGKLQYIGCYIYIQGLMEQPDRTPVTKCAVNLIVNLAHGQISS